MPIFERDRIAVRYPESWTAEEAEDAATGAWIVTLSSPGTAFFQMSLQPDADHPGDLADQTLETLKGEYEEIDWESVVETICGQPAVGFNADILTVDVATTCRVRCLSTEAGPLLLLAQVGEYDRAANEPVLAAIIKSLDIETD